MRAFTPEVLRLYLVTDHDLCGERDLLSIVQDAVRGGVTCVQLREKTKNSRDFVAQAQALKRLLSPLQIRLVINDRIDIALACEADGVHLGQSDMPIEDARRLLPQQVFIGWSVENLTHVEQASQLPVDYLGVSPVFATPTKTDTAPAWGLAGLTQVRQQTPLPLVAIGGIHTHNAAEVLKAGANGLAVVSAIMSAPDTAQAARTFSQIIQSHHQQGPST
jgi:thiamine-phosphate pyrophosphorylase